MRLVCPNCAAQYEIDDRVMPETGRDVQCSNCGHGWFHAPAPKQTPAPPAASPFVDIDPASEDTPPAADSAADIQDDPPDTASRPPRKLDDNVRDILQEEAKRELTARSAEQSPLETQDDLGLDAISAIMADADKDPADDPIEASHAVSDDMQDIGTDGEPDGRPASLKGREALPDIEEINSTLDAPEDGAEPAAEGSNVPVDAKSGGFRRGFVSVVVVACVLAILYIMAPSIGERIPALQPFMEHYIDIADHVRVGLEDMMRMAISKMQGLMEQPQGN